MNSQVVYILKKRIMRMRMDTWPLELIKALKSEKSICGEVIHDLASEWIKTNIEAAVLLLRTSRHEGRRLLSSPAFGREVLNRKRRKQLRMVERWANRLMAESGYTKRFPAHARSERKIEFANFR